LYYFAHLLQ